MGIFRRLFPQREAGKTLATTDLSTGDFRQAIVGEASYQEELRRIAAGRTERQERVEFRVVLVPEPGNKYDPNAIAVYADSGRVIGYLSREEAAEYHESIVDHIARSKAHPSCMAMMAGGHGDKASIGVWLDIDLDDLE